MTVELILGDCLEVMKGMPDKSVNLVVTDPPYNIGKASWDKISDYIEWCGKWLKECERVLMDNGSFYFFHNDMEQVADLMIWIRENTNFVFKQFIVWNKRFEGVGNKGFLDGFIVTDGLRNYQQMAEYCLFYTFQDETGLAQVYDDRGCFAGIKEYMRKERDKIIDREGFTTIQQFNEWVNEITRTASVASRHYFADSQWSFPTKEMYERLQTSGLWRREYEDLRREYEDLRREYEDLRYTFNNQKTHHSVWNYEIAERNGHITPKPVDMLENIILHSSNEGDIVLDCFMGSGTTGVACVQTGRNFIGIEIDETYFKIAERRIKEAQMQPRLL
jgi:site-specific DNA-methyltransferase (adenine-specific)